MNKNVTNDQTPQFRDIPAQLGLGLDLSGLSNLVLIQPSLVIWESAIGGGLSNLIGLCCKESHQEHPCTRRTFLSFLIKLDLS